MSCRGAFENRSRVHWSRADRVTIREPRSCLQIGGKWSSIINSLNGRPGWHLSLLMCGTFTLNLRKGLIPGKQWRKFFTSESFLTARPLIAAVRWTGPHMWALHLLPRGWLDHDKGNPALKWSLRPTWLTWRAPFLWVKPPALLSQAESRI